MPLLLLAASLLWIEFIDLDCYKLQLSEWLAELRKGTDNGLDCAFFFSTSFEKYSFIFLHASIPFMTGMEMSRMITE